MLPVDIGFAEKLLVKELDFVVLVERIDFVDVVDFDVVVDRVDLVKSIFLVELNFNDIGDIVDFTEFETSLDELESPTEPLADRSIVVLLDALLICVVDEEGSLDEILAVSENDESKLEEIAELLKALVELDETLLSLVLETSEELELDKSLAIEVSTELVNKALDLSEVLIPQVVVERFDDSRRELETWFDVLSVSLKILKSVELIAELLTDIWLAEYADSVEVWTEELLGITSDVLDESDSML